MAARLREHAGARPHAQELLDEERVAAGALGDGLDELVRQRTADERVHELARVRIVDRLEVQHLARP